MAGSYLGRPPKLLTPGDVEVMRRDWAFSCERAVREIGYNVTPLREGLARTLHWMREKGLIPA